MLKMSVAHTYSAAFPFPARLRGWDVSVLPGSSQGLLLMSSLSCQPRSSAPLNVGFYLCCTFHFQCLHQQHIYNYVHYTENLCNVQFLVQGDCSNKMLCYTLQTTGNQENKYFAFLLETGKQTFSHFHKYCK